MYAVFKSRGETIRFLSSLKDKGVKAYRIPTPNKRGDMCSISVSFDARYLSIARALAYSGRYYTLVGFF